ncbi:MAG: thiol-disulfide isomerase/thioredoxin [Flavobacteriales bacterium]|jgi:thiol-disulfide isomerase/thioredoxin
MKNYFILLILTVLWAACSTPEVPKESAEDLTIHLSGAITNGQNGEFELYGSDNFELKSEVNDSGEFVMFFDALEPGYYTMRFAGERASIYLSPGDSIHLSLDSEQFDESLAFKGVGAGCNNYLVGRYLLDEKMDNEISYEMRFMLAAGEYKAVVDSMIQVRQDFLDRSRLKHDLPESFVTEQQLAITYERGIALYDYENGAGYYQDVDVVDVPEGYYSFAEELALENPSLMGNKSYEGYVDTRLNAVAKDMVSDETEGDYLIFAGHKIDCIDELFTSQEIKNKFLHTTMKDVVNYYGSSDLSALVEKFTKCCKDQKCIDEIKSEVNEWKVLWKGNPAPDFKYSDIDGVEVALSELKGKVVYVDVWASWCGPCRGEIPHLKDLEHDYHTRNVAFVSVSIDENEEAWREAVQSEELGGYQLLADAAWKSSICKDYKINGIPRFMLFDQAGNIVSVDAPRPSSGEEITDMLDELINKGQMAMAH